MIVKLTASHTLIDIQSIDEQNYFLDKKHNDERKRVAIESVIKDILHPENKQVRSCIEINVEHTEVQFHKIVKAEAYMVHPDAMTFIADLLNRMYQNGAFTSLAEDKRIEILLSNLK